MDVQALIDGLEKKKEELRLEYESKVKSIDATIHTLLGTSPTLNQAPSVPTIGGHFHFPDIGEPQLKRDKYKAFFEEKAFKRKVASILVAENRFMHIREIANIIGQLEPDLKSETLAKDISVALFAAKKDRDTTLTSITIGNMLVDSFWGSKNWLDEKGIPKPKHMYNKDQLSENRKQKRVL